MPLRTPYPKYNSADVLADLKTFGIEEKTSTAYEPNSTNHMKDKGELSNFYALDQSVVIY